MTHLAYLAYLPSRPPPDPPGGVKNLVFSGKVKKVMPIHGGFFQSLALRAYYPLCFRQIWPLPLSR